MAIGYCSPIVDSSHLWRTCGPNQEWSAHRKSGKYSTVHNFLGPRTPPLYPTFFHPPSHMRAMYQLWWAKVHKACRDTHREVWHQVSSLKVMPWRINITSRLLLQIVRARWPGKVRFQRAATYYIAARVFRLPRPFTPFEPHEAGARALYLQAALPSCRSCAYAPLHQQSTHGCLMFCRLADGS